MQNRFLFALIAVCGIQSSPVHAQADSSLTRRLGEAARSSATLRVTLHTGEAIQGRATGVRDSSLILVGRKIPLTGITAVERRTGRLGPAVVTLTIIGALVGGYVSATGARKLGEHPDEPLDPFAFGLGGILGGAAGAAIGFLVDHASSWVPVWSDRGR